MTRVTIIKIVGFALLLTVAVFIHYKMYYTGRQIEPRKEAVSASYGQMISGLGMGVATKGIMAGPAPAAQETFELTEKDTPLELISTLINAPFNQEPGEINPDNNWKVVLSQPEYAVSLPYSKCFRRKGPGMEIDLFSYAVPSLTDAKELIMAGELKIFKEIEQKAALDLLKSSGFETKPADYGFSPGLVNWTDVIKLEKGKLSGLMYYEQHGVIRSLKIRLEHKDRDGYLDQGPTAKHFFDLSGTTAKLIADVEQRGAAKIIGADWEEIKKMLTSGVNLNTTVSVDKLLAAKNSIEANMPEGENGALFLVLKKYLVDGMFPRITQDLHHQIIAGGVNPLALPELALLKENNIPYELQYLGDSYAPVKNSLFNVYGKYSDSYWGQYSFLKEMERGFSDSTCGLDSLMVIKEGEQFLSGHAGSPFLTRILFLLGKANESAYSVGLSLDTYDCIDKTDGEALIKDSEKHRLDAIKYYTEVLGRPDGKEYQEHLLHILPKLRTKGNTYCSFYSGCGPM
ncbi:MAG: hypothetical protein NTX59_14230 [Elusimicrobia bacterium]|nr:hypothetical protein [Elusimicrobiota bacterium]